MAASGASNLAEVQPGSAEYSIGVREEVGAGRVIVVFPVGTGVLTRVGCGVGVAVRADFAGSDTQDDTSANAKNENTIRIMARIYGLLRGQRHLKDLRSLASLPARHHRGSSLDHRWRYLA